MKEGNVTKNQTFITSIMGKEIAVIGESSLDEVRSAIESYEVFPGIEISFNKFKGDFFKASHTKMPRIMQINYCRCGRIGWDMKDGNSVFLGEGDLSIHMLDGCISSDLRLPLGIYEGVSINIDWNYVSEHLPELLADVGVDFKVLIDKFCHNGNIARFSAHDSFKYMFTQLYKSPDNFKNVCFKLKIQELFLQLYEIDLSKEKSINSYSFTQIEVVKEIHEELINNLEQRLTIDQLAKKYHINSTMLKETFKNIYGLPIATYMKKYRINEAAKKISNTNDSIANISWQVGYKNQSKFAKAFKDMIHLSPNEYRQQYN